MLAGAEGRTAELTVEHRPDDVAHLRLPRKSEYWGFIDAKPRHGDVLAFLASGVGYADLDRLTVAMVDEMFQRFQSARAIVFDMRGYPTGPTGAAIAGRLMS